MIPLEISLVCSLKFLTPYPKDGQSSLDDLLLRGFKRGVRGLLLGGRAPLGCGKTQNMFVCVLSFPSILS